MEADEASDFELLFAFIAAPVRQFGLAIATADHVDDLARTRGELARRATEAGIRIGSLDVFPGAPILDQFIAASAGADVLFVTGVERVLLDRYGGPQFSSQIEQLNWDRDRLAGQLRTRVVLWMLRPAARALAEAARDLNDVVLGRYDLATDVVSVSRGLGVIPSQRARASPRDAERAPLLDRVLAERPSDTLGWADAANDRAAIAARAGEFDLARALTERALAVYGRLGEARKEARSWARLAHLASLEGSPEEGLRLAREHAFPRALASNDLRSMTLVRGQIGSLLTEAGHDEDAFRFVRDELMPIAEQQPDPGVLALARRLLALHLAQRGNAPGARELLRASVTGFREDADLENELKTLRELAEVDAADGNVEAALRTLRSEALPLAIQLDDPLEQAITLSVIADLIAASGQRDQALAIFRDEVHPLAVRSGISDFLTAVEQRIAALGG